MSTMRKVRLTRAWFSTDYDMDDVDNPEYLGAVSEPFMAGGGREIVDVDWSIPGEVQVTFMEPV